MQLKCDRVLVNAKVFILLIEDATLSFDIYPGRK